MKRIDQLREIAEKLGDDQKTVILPLVDNIAFMENKLDELRSMPQIRVHPRDPARQQITPAGKAYKETMQSYIGAIKVVLSALNKAGTDEADELLEVLKDFEL